MLESSLLSFNGDKKNWPIWSIQWRSREVMSGYGDVMDPGYTPDKTDIEFEDQKKDNERGFCELVCSMTKPDNVLLLSQSTNSVFEEGSLSEGWKNLKKKYEPKDVLSKLELMSKYENCKLENVGDSERWINQMVEKKDSLVKKSRGQ